MATLQLPHAELLPVSKSDKSLLGTASGLRSSPNPNTPAYNFGPDPKSLDWSLTTSGIRRGSSPLYRVKPPKASPPVGATAQRSPLVNRDGRLPGSFAIVRPEDFAADALDARVFGWVSRDPRVIHGVKCC